MSAFEIYDVAAGEGTLGICQLPGKAGDYAGDLARIVKWAPDLVISVVQSAEFAIGQAEGLACDVQAAGGRWRQFAVEDYGVPDGAAQNQWCDLSAEALQVLGCGGRVLVHCHGGCGRSGMVLLRLKVAQGCAPDVALSELRAARPCAVETEQQMLWATTGLRGL